MQGNIEDKVYPYALSMSQVAQHGRARLDEAYGKAAPSLLANRTYETNLTLEQKTANYNKMYPPWPLPGIHCGGHFDNAHYILNQKVYFPTWMENAANTLNANLKLWLSNTRPFCQLTIGVVWTISVSPYCPKVTAQLCHRLRLGVRDQPEVARSYLNLSSVSIDQFRMLRCKI
ncbi:hypothetical protein OUZ56_019536 [Daphnia magna]|uniref:Uncharacterized protein n=1 Tax=Daphnia magna TaxID=35525 RepID=A0ABQ9ZBW3_9CRUS|nr:hypothetical protein OUZ56_019536 [Daphnia magna]